MASSSSSSSSHNWLYDVFPSFRGEDVRISFLSHLHLALDRKLIKVFKDNKIPRSLSIDSVLVQAIRGSRIAIVIISENYGSSSWCLKELVEIMKCKGEFDQIVIPIFYGLKPSHVRKQTGKFGKAFEKTCQNKSEHEKELWQKALTNVAGIAGYYSGSWDNEASVIQEIANDLLVRLKLTPSSMDFNGFVGMEDHMANMSLLMSLESEEVRMVGIWGPSGIGKTSIGRALYSRISRHFQGSIFIDKAFISTTMETYSRANPCDYNMRCHLQSTFLAKILDKENIKVDHLGAVRESLRHQKVLIVLDDLDEQVVLDTLTGQTHWFGCGSRIIVITKDKHLLRAHRIDHIYEVLLPSKSLALKMFCQSAFRQNSPPMDFTEMAYEVTECAGSLPLGLNILGSSLRGRSKEDWMDMMPRLQNRLDGKIEKSLRVSYDGLGSKEDKAIFRHIACLFNFKNVDIIKKLLADSDLDVNIGLKNLDDKSLIRIDTSSETVAMHCLVQEMGKEIVRTQFDEPRKREFLLDWKDVNAVLKNKTGTKKVLGISLDTLKIDKLHINKKIDKLRINKKIDKFHINKSAFKKVPKLRFLTLHNGWWDEEVRYRLPEGLEYLPPKLRLLSWDAYPIRNLPTSFRAKHLVELEMVDSKHEKLWDGVQSLTCLKDMNLSGSENLKELPDLSRAINLEKLNLSYCHSLVELPSSIQHLNKLWELNMAGCIQLETLPAGINLRSLYRLILDECSSLRSLPDISTNISILSLDYTAIEIFPSKWRLIYLVILSMNGIENERLWEGVQPFPFLELFSVSDSKNLKEIPDLSMARNLKDIYINNCPSLVEPPSSLVNLNNLQKLLMITCPSLGSFPNVSANISELNLHKTMIEEVPWWIEKYSKLERLIMAGSDKLKYVPPNIYKLKRLKEVDFSNCGALTEASWHGWPSVASSVAKSCYPKFKVNFINCFNLNQEVLIQQKSPFKRLILPGEKVPSYFTHRTDGSTILIPLLLQSSLSQQCIGFRACLVVKDNNSTQFHDYIKIDIHVQCYHRGIITVHTHFAKYADVWSAGMKNSHIVIFDYHFFLNTDNAPLAELNCDEVEIKFHIAEYEILRCGILSEVYSSLENGPGSPIIPPRVLEDDESSDDNDLGNETDYREDCGDSDDSDLYSQTDHDECEYSDDSYISNETDQSDEHGESDGSDIVSETDQSEESEDNDISDISNETDDIEESGDSDAETKRSSKRMRMK